LDRDILLVPSDQIEKARVCVTIKSGETLYSNL